MTVIGAAMMKNIFIGAAMMKNILTTVPLQDLVILRVVVGGQIHYTAL